MQIYTIADITPNSVATPLSATTKLAVWVQLSATGAAIRYGDSNVGSARGAKIPTGTVVTLPRCDFNQGGYDLTKIYVYGTGADAVSISYGQ